MKLITLLSTPLDLYIFWICCTEKYHNLARFENKLNSLMLTVLTNTCYERNIILPCPDSRKTYFCFLGFLLWICELIFISLPLFHQVPKIFPHFILFSFRIDFLHIFQTTSWIPDGLEISDIWAALKYETMKYHGGGVTKMCFNN